MQVIFKIIIYLSSGYSVNVNSVIDFQDKIQQVPGRAARFVPGSRETLLCDGIPQRWRPHAPHDAGTSLVA